MRTLQTDAKTMRRWGSVKSAFSGRRALLFVLLWLTLAALLHFREQRVFTPELGQVSPKYVIAHINFRYADPEKTLAMQQDEMRDVGDIYQLNQSEVAEKAKNALNSNWRDRVSGGNIDDVHLASRYARKYLQSIRLMNSRTYERLKRANADDTTYLVGVPEGGVFQITSPTLWSHLRQKMVAEGIKPGIANHVIEELKDVRWNIEQDYEKQNALQELIKERVPTQYRQMPAGGIIVRKGETVTRKHLAMILGEKKAMSQARDLANPYKIGANLLLSLIFSLLGFSYIRFVYPDIHRSFAKSSLLIAICILTIFFAKGMEYYLMYGDHQWTNSVGFPLYVPVASILAALLIGSQISLLLSGFLTVVLTLSLAVNIDRFLVINLIGAVVCIISSQTIRRRRQVFTTCMHVFSVSIVVVFIFNLLQSAFWTSETKLDIYLLFFNLVISGALIVTLLPAIESIFGTMTDMRLMEWLDPSNALLARMRKELQGTAEHSARVATLAENAAEAIGARSLLCHVAASFHDVGKLKSAHMFTENQSLYDIHKLMRPQESASAIISHVKDGAELAKKHGLPKILIDFIKQHHGTTLAGHFYNLALKEAKEGEVIDEKEFRYPGPKPQTKEAGILMLADSLEAASRSADIPLDQLANFIFTEKIKDGQFDECPLSMMELDTIKQVLINTLKIAGHKRVAYEPAPDVND